MRKQLDPMLWPALFFVGLLVVLIAVYIWFGGTPADVP